MSSRTYTVSATVEIEDPDWNGDDEKDNRGGTLYMSGTETIYEPSYSYSGGMPDPGGSELEDWFAEYNGEEITEEAFVSMWGDQHKEYLQSMFDKCYEGMEEV